MPGSAFPAATWSLAAARTGRHNKINASGLWINRRNRLCGGTEMG
jgi:hypothetical protein